MGPPRRISPGITLGDSLEPQNLLLARLPRDSRLRVLKVCEPVDLSMAQVLAVGGLPLTHVYFPLQAVISQMTRLGGTPVLEVGMVGCEGMVGSQMSLGVSHEPLHAVVQGPGSAWRIGRSAFEREVSVNVALQRVLHRYVNVTATQLAGSAACLRFHLLGPRLARWFLMTQDRARTDSFRVTHESLALMLGVRRVGVTTAAAALQRQGLVAYRRGQVSVLDRRALKEAACSCYAADLQTYKRILP